MPLILVIPSARIVSGIQPAGTMVIFTDEVSIQELALVIMFDAYRRKQLTKGAKKRDQKAGDYSAGFEYELSRFQNSLYRNWKMTAGSFCRRAIRADNGGLFVNISHCG